MKKRIVLVAGLITLFNSFTVHAQENTSSFDRSQAEQALSDLNVQLKELQLENEELQDQLSEIEETKASVTANDDLYQILSDKAVQFIEVYVPEDTSVEIENKHDVYRASLAPFVTTDLLNEIAPTDAEVAAELSQAPEGIRQQYEMYYAKVTIEDYSLRVDPATVGTDEVLVAVDIVQNVTKEHFLDGTLITRLMLTMVEGDGEWLISDITEINLTNMTVE
ncbi:hypothetical protein [Aerococcus sp. L_32]|uniref:hypothetical protein n=1 Tax=Aerococcus sp. L_32 TaxID=3422316 RepID=UPI003D6A0230